MHHSEPFPTISVVMATFNSHRTIRRALDSIAMQKYPKDRLEIIVVDGSSNDDTTAIAKQYGAKVVVIGRDRQNAEFNKAVGISHAKNDIIAMIDHDNILPHPEWLNRMVRPFMDHPEVVGVETLRYAYDPRESMLDRYFALFGTGDPFVWYLGRADRLSYMYDRYNLAGTVVSHNGYYVVRFHTDRIPTIGANGFLVRRALLLGQAQAEPGKYFDMDVNVDLIRKGFDTYAFADDAILHLTGYGNVWNYLRRRFLFMTQYHMGTGASRNNARRYEIYGKKDLWRLAAAIFFCTTLVVPVAESFRGWFKIRDRAWFLHPVMGLGFLAIYSWVIMRHQLEIYGRKILGR